MGRKPKDKSIEEKPVKQKSDYQIEFYPESKIYFVKYKNKYLGFSIATNVFTIENSMINAMLFLSEKQAKDFIKKHKEQKEPKKIIIEVE